MSKTKKYNGKNNFKTKTQKGAAKPAKPVKPTGTPSIWKRTKNSLGAFGTAVGQQFKGTSSMSMAKKVRNTTLGKLQNFNSKSANITRRTGKLANLRAKQEIPLSTHRFGQYVNKATFLYRNLKIAKKKNRIASNQEAILKMVTDSQKFQQTPLKENQITAKEKIQAHIGKFITTKDQTEKQTAFNAIKLEANALKKAAITDYNKYEQMRYEAGKALLQNPEVLKKSMDAHTTALSEIEKAKTNPTESITKAQLQLATSTNSTVKNAAKKNLQSAKSALQTFKQQYATQQALNPTTQLLQTTAPTYQQRSGINETGKKTTGFLEDYKRIRAEKEALSRAKKESILPTNANSIKEYLINSKQQTNQTINLSRKVEAIQAATAKLARTSPEKRAAITQASQQALSTIEKAGIVNITNFKSDLQNSTKSTSEIKQSLLTTYKINPKLVGQLMKEVYYQRLEKEKGLLTPQPITSNS